MDLLDLLDSLDLMDGRKGMSRRCVMTYIDEVEYVPYDEVCAVIRRLARARRTIRRLRAAIRMTLDENRHLADGEDCTLINLKRALGGKGVV